MLLLTHHTFKYAKGEEYLDSVINKINKMEKDLERLQSESTYENNLATDTTNNKQGKFTPGTHIPIVSPEIGFNDSVDYAFLDLAKDIWDFMKVRKKYWLTPLIITIVLMGALIVFTQGSVVAPFIYSIF